MATVQVLLSTTGATYEPKTLIIGMAGSTVDIEAMYETIGAKRFLDEVGFKWRVAEYLSCPKSGFRLSFEAYGVVQVVFGTIDEERRDGFVCAVCCASHAPWYDLIGPWNNRINDYAPTHWVYFLCVRMEAYCS